MKLRASGWEVRTYYIFYSSWFLVSVCVIALRASYASVTGLILESLSFEEFPLGFQFDDTMLQFIANRTQCAVEFISRGDELFCWVKGNYA